jgi:hypothetical protein
MTEDYALPLILLRKYAGDYEKAMLRHEWNTAYKIAADMVEMSLKLQDLSDD